MKKSIVEREPQELINVKGGWRTPEEIEEEEDRETEALGKALLDSANIDWEEEELKDQYRRTTYGLLVPQEQRRLDDDEDLCLSFFRHFEACFRMGVSEWECARKWATRVS